VKKPKVEAVRGELRNRIVGSGTLAPEKLLANPLNWRGHPRRQEEAVEGALEEVGWVQDVIVNRLPGPSSGGGDSRVTTTPTPIQRDTKKLHVSFRLRGRNHRPCSGNHARNARRPQLRNDPLGFPSDLAFINWSKNWSKTEFDEFARPPKSAL
jgi:hypothetical protein